MRSASIPARQLRAPRIASRTVSPPASVNENEAKSARGGSRPGSAPPTPRPPSPSRVQQPASRAVASNPSRRTRVYKLGMYSGTSGTMDKMARADHFFHVCVTKLYPTAALESRQAGVVTQSR